MKTEEPINAVEDLIDRIVFQMDCSGIVLERKAVRRLVRELTIIWGTYQIEWQMRSEHRYDDWTAWRDHDPDDKIASMWWKFISQARFGVGQGKPIAATKNTDTPVDLEPLKRFIPVIDRFVEDNGFPLHGNGRSYRIRSDGKGRTTPPWQELALLLGQHFHSEIAGGSWAAADRKLREDIENWVQERKENPPERLTVSYNEKGERIFRRPSTYEPGIGMYARYKQGDE